jgi:hypothetical protein
MRHRDNRGGDRSVVGHAHEIPNEGPVDLERVYREVLG